MNAKRDAMKIPSVRIDTTALQGFRRDRYTIDTAHVKEVIENSKLWRAGLLSSLFPRGVQNYIDFADALRYAIMNYAPQTSEDTDNEPQ